MLNLKELERKLDGALSNETEKSLSQWLLNKRFKGFEFLGEGTFEELVPSHTVIHAYRCESQNEFEHSEEYSPIGEYEYAMAA
jgi:hypothetical protein